MQETILTLLGTVSVITGYVVILILKTNKYKTHTNMKNPLLLTMVLCTTLLFSCRKENIQPDNPNSPSQATTGTLYFKNTQADPYTIFLDNSSVYVLPAGQTSIAYTVSSGIPHNVKAEQFSGYVLYPTIFTGTATVNPNGTITWEF